MTLTASSYKLLHKGSPAPEFKLEGVDGKIHSLAEFKGKKGILIIFMCNHCPYVVPKMDYFVQLQEKYGSKGIQIIGINANDTVNYPEDSFEKMKDYAKKFKFNFPYLIDKTQKTARSYGAECTPDPFLFDGDFKMVYHGRFDEAHGKAHSEGKTAEIEDAIIQLLKGEDVTVQPLPSMGCSIKWKEV